MSYAKRRNAHSCGDFNFDWIVGERIEAFLFWDHFLFHPADYEIKNN